MCDPQSKPDEARVLPGQEQTQHSVLSQSEVRQELSSDGQAVPPGLVPSGVVVAAGAGSELSCHVGLRNNLILGTQGLTSWPCLCPELS